MRTIIRFLNKRCVFYNLFYAHPVFVGLLFFFVLFILKVFVMRGIFEGKIYLRQWHTDNEGEALLAIMAACIASVVRTHKNDGEKTEFYDKVWWFMLLYVLAIVIMQGAIAGDVMRGERSFYSLFELPSEWEHAFLTMPFAFALLPGKLIYLWKHRQDPAAKCAKEQNTNKVNKSRIHPKKSQPKNNHEKEQLLF